MRFGLGTPALILYPPVMSDWERDATGADILRVARKADELGYDWMVVPEHIFIPNDMLEIMGPRYPEAMTASAVLAGGTQRINILTYILVLPYRDPVILAKQIATLDFLSNGRFMLGTASGHMEGEFDVLKVPYKERGARTDEYLRVMKELWTSDRPSFQGRFVQFDNIAFEPKPVQKPHPPVLIGGNSAPAMRRAATCDGWLPWLVSRKQLPEKLDQIRQMPGYKEPFQVIMPLAQLNVEDYTHRELGRATGPRGKDQIVEEIGKLADAGCTGVQVGPGRTRGVEPYLEWTEWFAAEIMPAFR